MTVPSARLRVRPAGIAGGAPLRTTDLLSYRDLSRPALFAAHLMVGDLQGSLHGFNVFSGKLESHARPAAAFAALRCRGAGNPLGRNDRYSSAIPANDAESFVQGRIPKLVTIQALDRR